MAATMSRIAGGGLCATVCATVVVCFIATTPAAAGFEGSQYVARGKCGPYPRAQVTTPDWACVGLVIGPDHGLRWPRVILAVPGNRFVISDMVGWTARGRGRIHLLTVRPGGGVTSKILFANRTAPHGLALGPDGLVYVGDEDRIWRFRLDDPDPKAETILTGLPAKSSRSQRFTNVDNHWHPLSHIRFDLEGNLLVNLGAPRDHCALKEGREPLNFPYPCPWTTGPNPQAAVWKLEFSWPEGQPGRPGKFKSFARGLRNSMALAVHPRSGLVLQAENNIDLWNGRSRPEIPPEEINILTQGAHYGWPYCAGNGQVVPEYGRKGVSCGRYKNPQILMPAHAAPIGMDFYFGSMFPELRGKLLVALHGSKKWGHRIVAYDTHADGKPKAPKARRGGYPGLPDVIVGGWTNKRGVRPTGRPIGFAIGGDGAVWFIDDKARTVMVLLRAARGPEDADTGGDTTQIPPPHPKWAGIYGGVLKRRCAACHEEFRHDNALTAWRDLALKGFLDPENIAGSPMMLQMLSKGNARPMPPAAGLAPFPEDLARLNTFLQATEDDW